MSDIVVEAKRDNVLDFGPITRRNEATGLPQAIDLNAAGVKLWFTVKATPSDAYADAKVTKDYVAGGSSDGFIITIGSSTDSPNGTITIPRSELPIAARWYWDLLLEEPGGRRSTVDSGPFKVVLPVSDPA